MSIYRQSVHDYICACEALLALPALSDHEMQAVEAMMTRLSDQLLSSGERYQPVTGQEEAFVLTKAQVAALQEKWKQQVDPPACEHPALDLGVSDSGHLTGNHHCIECGEIVVRKL